MGNATENNVVALLEECLSSGDAGPGSLWLWFLKERLLIEQAVWDANFENGVSVI